MWSATKISFYSFYWSTTTKNKSNLERIGVERLRFCLRVFFWSYFPNIGLAAARIDVLAFKFADIPAFDIEIVYCSIASCIDVISYSFILSNSSIQHIPSLANSKAPASITNSPVSWSFYTEAVKPAAVLVLPAVYILHGENSLTNFSI